MMGQPKPLASLSSGLLARKGGARPAMRPQAFAAGGNHAQALDDLGWNDMGSAAPEAAAEPIPAVASARPVVPEPAAEPAPVPQVLVEREALAQELETPAAVRSVSVATATRLRRETTHVGKSAQVLVTQALDHFLTTVPDVDALVAQLPPAKRNR